MFVSIARKYLSSMNTLRRDRIDRLMIAAARTHALANRRQERLRDLTAAEFSGFSQWGEDGIIDWLVEKLPGIPETFVEFGVDNYREANTRMLLQLRNWRGLVLDPDEENVATIREDAISWRYDLTATQAFVDRENVNAVIGGQGVAGEIGLLSIDIDGNDYWVWEALDIIDPWIVVCEYQAILGDIHPLSTPYRPDFDRRLAHSSMLYFGASVRALEEVGRRKGYTVIGTCSNGANLFLVRDDKVDGIRERLEGLVLHGARFRESRDAAGRLSFLRGAERTRVIEQLDYVDVRNGSLVKPANLAPLYSPDWQRRYFD